MSEHDADRDRGGGVSEGRSGSQFVQVDDNFNLAHPRTLFPEAITMQAFGASDSFGLSIFGAAR